MARVRARPAADAADRRDGPGPAPATDDDRGVRVMLAPTSRHGDDVAVRIAVLAQRHAEVDGEPVDAALRNLGGGRHVLEEGSGATRVILEPLRRADGGPAVREVIVDGFRFDVEMEAERRAALRERAALGRVAGQGSGPLEVRAIIPGKVASVWVVAGDAVIAGQQLLVVEAMKMHNELRAPRDGTIERVGVAEGVKIEVGDLLLVIG